MRPVATVFPKVHIAPIREGTGFTTWCRGCSTYGYSPNQAGADSFRKRHETKCGEGGKS